MTTLQFLKWLHGRLINVYTESQYVDFAMRLRAIIDGATEVRWCRKHDDMFLGGMKNACRTGATIRLQQLVYTNRCVEETKYLIGG